MTNETLLNAASCRTQEVKLDTNSIEGGGFIIGAFDGSWLKNTLAEEIRVYISAIKVLRDCL